MKTFNILPLFALFLFSPSASAICLKSMPIQQIVDCLTIENTGQNYQQWQHKIALSVQREVEQSKLENDQFVIAQNIERSIISNP